MADTKTAIYNRTAIAGIRKLYSNGEISRDQAKILAQPILDSINFKQAEIAKRHGKKNYPKMDFISLMR